MGPCPALFVWHCLLSSIWFQSNQRVDLYKWKEGNGEVCTSLQGHTRVIRWGAGSAADCWVENDVFFHRKWIFWFWPHSGSVLRLFLFTFLDYTVCPSVLPSRLEMTSDVMLLILLWFPTVYQLSLWWLECHCLRLLPLWWTAAIIWETDSSVFVKSNPSHVSVW